MFHKVARTPMRLQGIKGYPESFGMLPPLPSCPLLWSLWSSTCGFWPDPLDQNTNSLHEETLPLTGWLIRLYMIPMTLCRQRRSLEGVDTHVLEAVSKHHSLNVATSRDISGTFMTGSSHVCALSWAAGDVMLTNMCVMLISERIISK